MEDVNANVKFLIIEEVKRRPFIWSKRKSDDAGRGDQLKKIRAWREIAELCSSRSRTFTDKMVATMWRSLRDRANKLHKKRETTTDSGATTDDDVEETREKWIYWPAMQFIFGRSDFASLRNSNVHVQGEHSSAAAFRGASFSRPTPAIGFTSTAFNVDMTARPTSPNDSVNSSFHDSYVDSASPPPPQDTNPEADVIMETGEEHAYSSRAMHQRNGRPQEAISNELSSRERHRKSAASAGGRKRKVDTVATLEETLVTMFTDEYAMFGQFVAETLRRGNRLNAARAKQCKLAMMTLLTDLENDL